MLSELLAGGNNLGDQLNKEKEYMVVKSNELVQKSRFKLSVNEQKTVAYICSKIKPVTDVNENGGSFYQLEYEFDIREYFKMCELDYDNGNNYAYIKKVLKGLRDQSIWLTLPDGSETTVSWLSKVTTSKRSGKVKVVLDEDMVPYLFNLKERFTAYRLLYVIHMKSQFSLRVYEILRSYAWQTNVYIELEEFKKMLMIDDSQSYGKRFPDFRRFILDNSLEEINEYTDLRVTYDTEKKGRKVVGIQFHIVDVNKETMNNINMKYSEVEAAATQE